MKKLMVAPSVLAANFARLDTALGDIASSGAEWVHLDVMDGHFVPGLTFGPKMVADLRPLSSLPFDVHLMVDEPERFIQDFIQAGADYITFHAEAAVHGHRILKAIRDSGGKAGISIVPSTPVSLIEELLPFADLALVMTVNPGYGGQTLIRECLDKARRLAEIRREKGYNFLISVDGGINPSTVSLAREAGVDVAVAGEAFFKAPDKGALVACFRGGDPQPAV
jgi:ribulose-phosphate 3-epimerase